MKTLFFTVITAVLIMAGCQAYGSAKSPKPAIKHSEQIMSSLRHSTVAPSQCPFMQAGHF
jgi:hypothetical protein